MFHRKCARNLKHVVLLGDYPQELPGFLDLDNNQVEEVDGYAYLPFHDATFYPHVKRLRCSFDCKKVYHRARAQWCGASQGLTQTLYD